MRLVKNAKKVITKAWSVRLMALSAGLIVLSPVFDMLEALNPASLVVRLSAGVVSLLAIWARIYAQKEFENDVEKSS